MRKNDINKIMNASLGDALTIVLERNHVEYTVSEELLDDLTECFWKMLPYYLIGVRNNGK